MGVTRVRVEHLAKQYRLGEIGTGTISHDLNRWWAKIRGKEDPFSTVGVENDRTVSTKEDYVWALQDIDFEVKEGEILGIIGKNGAGKSTLLKLLSKVTGPTKGQIKINGRIGALLEVGTGMHPELTGVENIYLNGAILGMTKKEITNKLEEIIEFAGIAKYADTPFKRYSSGMRVRLGFAVAAFLEPEILIVDEVLAVGDVEFQKKAIGKMKSISEGEGRTVLFVSHNMASIKTLCNKGIVLKNGKIVYKGNAAESVAYYLSQNQDVGNQNVWSINEAPGNEKVKILNFSALSDQNDTNMFIDSIIKIKYALNLNIEKATIGTTIRIVNQEDQVVFSDGVLIAEDKNSEKRVYEIETSIPAKLLNSGSYSINVVVGENKRYVLYSMDNVVNFQVSYGGDLKHGVRQKGILYSELDWSVK